jgi:hypothetical protein
VKQEFQQIYGYELDITSFKNTIEILQGKSVSKGADYIKYCHIDIVNYDKKRIIQRLMVLQNVLSI